MHLIDVDKLKQVVVSGLKKYLGCEVIRTNQNAEPPAYPYVSYTITTLASANNGTYEEYEDDTTRKMLKQTWSVTAQSNKESESVSLALKAREWLDYSGKMYLRNNGVVVQSVTSVTNRDNILTVEYEYKNGFDVVFYLYDETNNVISKDDIVEDIVLADKNLNGQSTVNSDNLLNEIEKMIDDSGILDD